MHEYAIAEGVIGVVERCAGGRRVAAVELRVGHLRQVVPSALEFSFGIAARGTVAEGAELRLTSVAPVLLCAACGARTSAGELPLACGGCGGLEVTVIAGEELDVDSIEVYEDGEEPAETAMEEA